MSSQQHLSEDGLLDAIYGIAGIDAEAHLQGCAECRQRFADWQKTRAAAVETFELPVEFLTAQRKRIYERMDKQMDRPSGKWWWAPGLAAACALAIGIFVYHPPSQRQPEGRAEISDAQLFGEVYSMEQSLEPAAAAPARELFEEQQ